VALLGTSVAPSLHPQVSHLIIRKAMLAI
jgi:hypothetical protein